MSRTALAAPVVVASLAVASCGDDKSTTTASPSGVAPGSGKVTVVYDGNVKPEDRQAVEQLKRSRAFEPLPAWMNKSLALPHDLVVKVTDKVPPGVTDMVTQPDGRTVYVPPAFLNDIAGGADRIVKQ